MSAAGSKLASADAAIHAVAQQALAPLSTAPPPPAQLPPAPRAPAPLAPALHDPALHDPSQHGSAPRGDAHHGPSQHEDRGLLRFLTCGSVDDGKSTLIGRLLVDARAVLADALQAVERTSRRRGLSAVDLSLLTDGLQAEREQGITIDVAHRYFATARRKFIIADAPGHEQYTRNMVTAASNAHLAVLLVDARKGLLTQTRRHAFIAHQVGIRQLVVAVNKMDLVGWSEEVFEGVRRDFEAFAVTLGLGEASFVPLSALEGDMVVERGEHLGWYAGPTLLELLEDAAAGVAPGDERFRFPVQWVCRPEGAAGRDYRGYGGQVAAGEVAVGDLVKVLPCGLVTRVKAIRLHEDALQRAGAGQSVTLELEDDVDVSRGDMLVKPDEAPSALRRVEAMVCWLGDAPLSLARRYVLRHTTRETRAAVVAIGGRVDLTALAHVPADRLVMNDLGRVTLQLAQPVFADPYRRSRATGAFVLIDDATNATVGAGMILDPIQAPAREPAREHLEEAAA